MYAAGALNAFSSVRVCYSDLSAIMSQASVAVH